MPCKASSADICSVFLENSKLSSVTLYSKCLVFEVLGHLVTVDHLCDPKEDL